MVDQFLAAKDRSDDLDILASTLHRFLKGYAVPMLNDVRARWAEAKDDTSAGTFVQCCDGASQYGGSARINIGDTGPDFDAFGDPYQVGHRGK